MCGSWIIGECTGLSKEELGSIGEKFWSCCQCKGRVKGIDGLGEELGEVKLLLQEIIDGKDEVAKTKEEEINSETFATMSLGAHVRGKAKLEGRLSDKKKRKMKARNLYEHLDPKRHGHV